MINICCRDFRSYGHLEPPIHSSGMSLSCERLAPQLSVPLHFRPCPICIDIRRSSYMQKANASFSTLHARIASAIGRKLYVVEASLCASADEKRALTPTVHFTYHITCIDLMPSFKRYATHFFVTGHLPLRVSTFECSDRSCVFLVD